MKSLAHNKRANFDYDIKDTFVAGLVLSGAEVKSVKGGNVSLAGSYVTASPDAARLVNCHIGPYKYAPNDGYNPTQTRQLLMKKKEIDQLLGKEKGLVIVPIEIFATKQGWIKLKLGIGKARKKQDKREVIKKREVKRDIRNQI